MLIKKVINKIRRMIGQTLRFIHLICARKELIQQHWVHINSNLPTQPISTIPKIIWVYWQSDKPNDLVNLCLYSIKKFCGNYDVRILNTETVKDYIEIPTFHKDLKPAGVSDFIRFSLLAKYGGIWLDASIFLTDSLDWIFDKMKQEKSDLFLSYCDACTQNKGFPVIDSWMIIAPPKHPFICDWLEEFKLAIFSESPTTYYKSYLNKEILQKIPNVDYLICYASAMLVLNRRKYNVLYVNSGSCGHYFNYRLDWNRYYIAYILLSINQDKLPIPKLIKFTGSTRKPTEQWIKYKKYNINSILGRLLKDMQENK